MKTALFSAAMLGLAMAMLYRGSPQPERAYAYQASADDQAEPQASPRRRRPCPPCPRQARYQRQMEERQARYEAEDEVDLDTRDNVTTATRRGDRLN